MKGKTVVITGGTSGIGEVAAEALAKMGARIILVARSKSRAEATLARLRRKWPPCHPLHIFCRSRTLGRDETSGDRNRCTGACYRRSD